jgi:hypothetical protein
MKVGDLVTVEGNVRLIVHEFTFKEYCEKHDDLGLEYDIDDAWKNWEKSGPLYQVIDEEGKIRAMWRSRSG